MLAQGGTLASTSRYSPGQKEAGQDSIFGEEEEESDALDQYRSPFQSARCGGSVKAVKNHSSGLAPYPSIGQAARCGSSVSALQIPNTF